MQDKSINFCSVWERQNKIQHREELLDENLGHNDASVKFDNHQPHQSTTNSKMRNNGFLIKTTGSRHYTSSSLSIDRYRISFTIKGKSACENGWETDSW